MTAGGRLREYRCPFHRRVAPVRSSAVYSQAQSCGLAPSVTGRCGADVPTLIVHHADRLWAFCPDGPPLPGWGRALGDTIVAGLGAGDPDGDGFPEVLTQSVTSKVTFWNESGYPSPGWPRAST